MIYSEPFQCHSLKKKRKKVILQAVLWTENFSWGPLWSWSPKQVFSRLYNTIHLYLMHCAGLACTHVFFFLTHCPAIVLLPQRRLHGYDGRRLADELPVLRRHLRHPHGWKYHHRPDCCSGSGECDFLMWGRLKNQAHPLELRAFCLKHSSSLI